MLAVEEMVELFRCPETGARLEVVDDDMLDDLNDAVRAGELSDAAGTPVEVPLDAALRPVDADFVYPVRDEMPNFVVENRIPLPLP